MATKRDGEKYLGEALHVPLSSDGQVAAYVWPIRILNVAGKGCGGPTIGVDVGNEEVLRFDCHAESGHWHGGGYDRSGIPRSTHREFPEGLVGIQGQVAWSLKHLSGKTKDLLEEAEYGQAAQAVVPSMLQSAIKNINSHLEQQGDLRSKAIRDNLIDS
jgi:hypothetical protein